MSDSQIVHRLNEIARNMRQCNLKETDQYADQVEIEAANLKALFDAEVAGTHAFDMIAAIEMGNVEITETLIHMVAATVLAKLIEEEGGGRSNISFSPADMDAMHRDYEMQAKRDGLVTTITLVPRDHMTHTAGGPALFDTILPADALNALPQVEASVAKPYWFFNDNGFRLGPMTRDEAVEHLGISKNPLAHVENRMCPNAACKNSDMQGACPSCYVV